MGLNYFSKTETDFFPIPHKIPLLWVVAQEFGRHNIIEPRYEDTKIQKYFSVSRLISACYSVLYFSPITSNLAPGQNPY